MVITLFAQEAVTPAGRPIGVPIPVAPVVEMVMEVSVVLMQSVGEDEGVPAVLSGFTVMLPVAFTLPQPPVSGIV